MFTILKNDFPFNKCTHLRFLEIKGSVDSVTLGKQYNYIFNCKMLLTNVKKVSPYYTHYLIFFTNFMHFQLQEKNTINRLSRLLRLCTDGCKLEEVIVSVWQRQRLYIYAMREYVNASLISVRTRVAETSNDKFYLLFTCVYINGFL